MAHIVTQRDIELLTLRNRNTSLKLELMNKRFQVLNELQGKGVSCSLPVQSESDLRRTCSLTLLVKESSYRIASDASIWLDKLIRMWYVVYDPRAKEDRPYPMGIFTPLNGSHNFDATTGTLSLSMADLMATLAPERGSALGTSEIEITIDSDIRNAMIATITNYGGVTRYRIDEFPAGQREVPYDLTFPAGTYPIEIAKKLRDIYPCREMFFDTDAVFVCQEIPTAMQDDVILTADIMDQLLIASSPTTDLTQVKNATEIWGMSLESDRWSETCISEDGVYKLSIPDIETMDSGVSYGFKVDVDSVYGQQAQINDLAPYPICIEVTHADGTSTYDNLQAGTMRADTSYVLYYSDGRFLLQGELEIHVMVMEVNAEPSPEQKQSYRELFMCDNIKYVVNPESPFAIDRDDIGIIKQVLKDGEFADITTTELAFDRAAYENWKSTRLQDTALEEYLIVPWLDVNQKYECTNPITGEVEQRIIKSITFDFGQSTMQIDSVKFYPFYPWL